jgi:hypothetical protein
MHIAPIAMSLYVPGLAIQDQVPGGGCLLESVWSGTTVGHHGSAMLQLTGDFERLGLIAVGRSSSTVAIKLGLE